MTFRSASCALGAALMLGACGGPPEPEAVETCLREQGLSVAQQSGLSAPVEAKVNFAESGTPDPATSGQVIFYSSEDEATTNLAAAERQGLEVRQEGEVLYTPFRAGGTPQESETLVEGCVTTGQAGTEDDDSDKKKKKKKKR
jgi:hypothetical protein